MGYLRIKVYQCYGLGRMLIIAFSLILLSIHSVRASFYFEPSLLSSQDANRLQATDLSAIVAGNIPEGEYLVDVYINNVFITTKNLTFVMNSTGKMQPNLSLKMLDNWGVNVAAIESTKHIPLDHILPPLERIISHATTNFISSQLRLNISIPQASMKTSSDIDIPPSLFDEGINAFILNYTLSGNTIWSDITSRQNSNFFGLHSGLNISAWRLRNDATYIKTTQGSNRWTLLNTYLERDIPSLKGEIILGDSQSTSAIFESIPLRGIQFVSNESMLQTTKNRFMPIVTGFANSNATVRISQNGQIIYQTNVAPGPFKFSDIISNGASGDLLITVTESNGSQHIFRKSYSSLPTMQRIGHIKYEMVLGKYNGSKSSLESNKSIFSMGTMTYGLPYDVTLYTGFLFSPKYQSYLIGDGISLGVMGAMSTDIAISRHQYSEPHANKMGEQYRIQYVKNIIETNTTLNLSLSGDIRSPYESFKDSNIINDEINNNSILFLNKRRQGWQISLSQSFDEWGNITFSWEKYEDIDGNTNNKSRTLSYYESYSGVNFYINYSIEKMHDANTTLSNRQVSFDIQIPLSLLFSSPIFNNQYETYHTSNNSLGQSITQVGLNGNLFDKNIDYNIMMETKENENNSLYATYHNRDYKFQTGYYSDKSSHNLTYGLSGGALIHAEGVTLSQTMGDSVALIKAKGANHVRVLGNNIYTNSNGYAVVPYLKNYQRNTVNLDPNSLPDDVNITDISKMVYPTSGAVVMATYKVAKGKKILMTLIHAGEPVPLGAIVLSTEGDNAQKNMVGDNGIVYLTGMPETGEVKATWGENNKQVCSARYSLKKKNDSPKGRLVSVGYIQQLTEICK